MEHLNLNGKKICAVVVPCHKKKLNAEEIESMRRIRKILGRYDKFVSIPDDFSFGELSKKNRNAFRGFYDKKFDRKHFLSHHAHNCFLCKSEFWESFSDYEFILLHELDSLVISDEIIEWCAKDYDYIGAPWFTEPHDAKVFEAVGNGGFSLRRVQSHLRVLDIYKRCEGVSKKNDHSSAISLPTNKINDDIFWALRAKKWDPSFKVAPLKDALSFSFEYNPSYCYEKNSRKLPCGCHWWAAIEPDFWVRHIDFPFEVKMRYRMRKTKKIIKKVLKGVGIKPEGIRKGVNLLKRRQPQ